MTTLQLNGKPFPGSMWGHVLHKVCGGDPYAAARILFRARKATNPVAWIKRGLIADENGERYALSPCLEETENPGGVRAWIDKHVFNIAPIAKPAREKSAPSSVADILKGIAEGG